jgi:hypothetical protein
MADKDKMAKYRTEIQQVCSLLFCSLLSFVFAVDLPSSSSIWHFLSPTCPSRERSTCGAFLYARYCRAYHFYLAIKPLSKVSTRAGIVLVSGQRSFYPVKRLQWHCQRTQYPATSSNHEPKHQTNYPR